MMTIRCKTKYNLFTDVEMEKCEGSKPSLDFRSLRYYVADCKQSYPAKHRRIIIFFDCLDT